MNKKPLNKFDLIYFMKKLAENRPIFHNEKDFQFEFAWLAKEEYDCDVRLEYSYLTKKVNNSSDNIENKRCYIDIVLQNTDNECILFELKYKTLPSFDGKPFKDGNKEEFYLENQSGQTYGRYDVLSDLNRLETIEKENRIGKTILKYFSVLLTNDVEYMEKPKNCNTRYGDFALAPQHRKVINKGETLKVKPSKNNQEKDLKKTLTFENEYSLVWKDYYSCGDKQSQSFKYLYFEKK